MTPRFFATPADLRAWFDQHHATARELWVGYYKKGSDKPSVDWPQSVDEALCVGWIDGIRKSVDDERYTIRFTPRKPRSIWSTVNTKRVAALTEAGRMRPAGLKAFEGHQENRSGVYSYEQRPRELSEPYAGLMKKNKAAWKFFETQPPSYRRMAIWFVLSAKKEETRLARLKTLAADCAAGRWLRGAIRPKPAAKKTTPKQK